MARTLNGKKLTASESAVISDYLMHQLTGICVAIHTLRSASSLDSGTFAERNLAYYIHARQYLRQLLSQFGISIDKPKLKDLENGPNPTAIDSDGSD